MSRDISDIDEWHEFYSKNKTITINNGRKEIILPEEFWYRGSCKWNKLPFDISIQKIERSSWRHEPIPSGTLVCERCGHDSGGFYYQSDDVLEAMPEQIPLLEGYLMEDGEILREDEFFNQERNGEGFFYLDPDYWAEAHEDLITELGELVATGTEVVLGEVEEDADEGYWDCKCDRNLMSTPMKNMSIEPKCDTCGDDYDKWKARKIRRVVVIEGSDGTQYRKYIFNGYYYATAPQIRCEKCFSYHIYESF